jgi:hypothetical protein
MLKKEAKMKELKFRAIFSHPEAVFLVVCDPSMNEL